MKRRKAIDTVCFSDIMKKAAETSAHFNSYEKGRIL